MVEYFVLIFRTIILYILVLLIFRAMGKREIGELSILDLVVFIMIGELAVVAIEDQREPIMHSVFPMLLLMMIQITFSFISLKSKKFRDLIEGKPIIIINRGKIDEKEMRRQRYNFDDLLMQLREKDIRNIADVEFAILEPSGKLSVFEKENKKSGDITIPLIMDGSVMEINLSRINKTKLWLKQELKKKGYTNMKLISFCSYHNGTFYIDEKDEEK
ncbi:DUF421 domain-containing protein [Pseudoneobacillus rhizosphaerae]|uniref:YetF C-terminal domain-containing protein n=1 Tax=Pseudoneobacillus rhizosphaerae TaxID=2880968 RepID=A0A9C7G8L9_9BACI|nr:DUF421 domain-containing protein [Pseudoneobacillus rhizosphaerae]CAG9607969.1 hypothetical protein NEOCIP111885_01661 [Pseudoneobacillus rhizosphaerae]